MLRFPDVSATHIVFVHANDLWVVAREGGLAQPLAAPAGAERFPRFSPDGTSIAFMGNYEGNSDLYTIPLNGGSVHRITYHSGGEVLCDWTEQGELLYYTNALSPSRRIPELYRVPASGGPSTKLPVPYGANGALDPSGRMLAYTLNTRDARTWKRYRGGMASDVWLFDLVDHSAQRITNWEGTDSLPMWQGRHLYYVCDAGAEHRLNLWRTNIRTGEREQVTWFSDDDVRWPSMGPGSGGGEIVFQLGDELVLFDLQSGEMRAVEVRIPGDAAAVAPHRIDAAKFLAGAALSPSAKRVVVEARGELFSVPVEKGAPRRLTQSSGVADRDPSWSPDGRWIAFFSDRSGNYELEIVQSDGRDRRTLTQGSVHFLTDPRWSPDSRWITFLDSEGGFYLCEVESGETRKIDADPFGVFAGSVNWNWSPDSRWIAYSRSGEEGLNSRIHLYEVESGTKHVVTSGMFDDREPVFDRTGDFLFYVGTRSFSPTYSNLDTSFVYRDTQQLIAMPLKKEWKSFHPLQNEEESWEEEGDGDSDADSSGESEGGAAAEGDAGLADGDEAAGDQNSEEEGEGDPLRVEIDLEALEARSFALPTPAGQYSNLQVNDKGQLLYVFRAKDDPPAVKLFDPKDEESKVQDVAAGVGRFELNPDGTKMIHGPPVKVQDAAAGAEAKAVALDGMGVVVDLRAEWQQVYRDAWRLMKQYFYDPHMHGVDWDGVYAHYAPMIESCVTREDVEFVIGETIAEVNAGHAYIRGAPEFEQGPTLNVGLLGADFELHDGAYRFAKIYEGGSWDVDARNPLRAPEAGVEVGEYLLAVNGSAVDPALDVWAAFQGLAGKTTVLTVGAQPTLDGPCREILVQPMASDRHLRYRDWIERNRKYVEEKTGGRVGYIYVPDTQVGGQNDLLRQYQGASQYPAMIIDERWNSGGQIPTRFIELLARQTTNYWAIRAERDLAWPPVNHSGPKCMLINGESGSGGDAFPNYFRQFGLGKLIGTRTWGGLVGISGNPTFIDGGTIAVPTFAYYDNDGTWSIEGHGVDPDLEVVDDPSKMVDGGDPQLDAAIEWILSELERNPPSLPGRPAYPDRSGMGLPDSDK